MSPSVSVVNSTVGASYACILDFVRPSIMPPQSPPDQNFTRLPASLKTTALTTWQVRCSMPLGNASMQIPLQPFSSSALVFEEEVPSADPTSTKKPSLTPGNTASDTHLSWPI